MRISKFVKTCRQYVDFEFNGSTLYPSYPNMNTVNSVSAIKSMLTASDNSSNQMQDFYHLLENGNYAFPWAGTIHAYLKKYDSLWYENEYSGKIYS
jgi:hypothetical protein